MIEDLRDYKNLIGSKLVYKAKNLGLYDKVIEFAIENNLNNKTFSTKAFLFYYDFGTQEHLCKECHVNIISKINFSKGIHGLFCGLECSNKSKLVTELQKQGMQNKYGVDNCSKLQSVKDKKTKTFLKNCGKKHNWACNLEENRRKAKKTMIIKYGVDNASKSAFLRSKQNKSKFAFKEYVLPSGKIIKIQGYENKFLDEYFKNNGLESNLVHGDVEIENKIGKIFIFIKTNNVDITQIFI